MSVFGHKASLVGSQIAPLKRPVCTREWSLQECPCPNGGSDST